MLASFLAIVVAGSQLRAGNLAALVQRTTLFKVGITKRGFEFGLFPPGLDIY